MMIGTQRCMAVLGAAAFGATMLAPGAVLASASSRQKNKNLWRNLAIGAGVIAAHGLITHNGTETLLGAGGAAYSANRYEQDRRSQSRENSMRARFHRRYRRYHHYHHRVGRHEYYYRTSTASSGFPNYYPNIRYFRQNGHVYYRNLDTGQVYLAQW